MSGRCVACGCDLTTPRRRPGDKGDSPFLERRQVFERSPYMARKFNSFSVVPRDGVTSCGDDLASLNGLGGPKTAPDLRDSSPRPERRVPDCTCGSKIRELEVKFAETLRLLRNNTIKSLEVGPPTFKPPPPPTENKLKNCGTCLALNPVGEDVPNVSSDPKNTIICDKCSKSVVGTIEDLPKLLPTDALNRPQLGLSYSMEDDLSPGVKEILSSTPKSGVSLRFSPKVVAKDHSSLSTFSQSANSLGYVSSQSDLELNFSTPDGHEKVPVKSLKSQTLPIGVKLTPSPFYSASDHSHENCFRPDLRDGRFPNLNSSSGDIGLRSSSAPPLPPEAEKAKKKHIMRGFSRKERKDTKKKNDDNLSVKSDLSLDEGIILRKIETLDDSTDMLDSVDKSEGAEEKPKKRSVWKSILRKK